MSDMCKKCGRPVAEHIPVLEQTSGPPYKTEFQLAQEWCCPAPLSPIALDEAKDALLDAISSAGYEHYEGEELVEDYRRALVARVAQEEREKYEGRIKELEGLLAASRTLLAVKSAGCKCHYRYIDLPVA